MLNKLVKKISRKLQAKLRFAGCLVISFLLLSQTAAYALGENNSRLQYLLHRAKARQAGHTMPAQAPAVQEQHYYQPQTVQPRRVTPPQETHHYQPASQSYQAPKQTPIQRQAAPQTQREPVVIQTHPTTHAISAPPQRIKEPVQDLSHQSEIKTETQVIQPPVQTYIAPAASSKPVHTQTVKNSSIQVKHAKHQTTVIETHPSSPHHETTSSPAAQNYDETLEQPAVRSTTPVAPVVHHEPKPVVKEVKHAEPAPQQNSATKEVTNYLDNLLSKPVPNSIPVIDLKANEQKQIIHDEPKVKEVVAEPAPEPAPVKTVTEPKVKEVPAVTEVQAPEEPKTTIIPEEEAKLSQKDSDYLLVIRKSIKSLEDDPWTKVKTNMDEALNYFDREQGLHSDKDLGLYHKIVLACKRFSEGGLELDEGDFADFEEAESLYLDTKDLLNDVNKSLTGKDDYQSLQIKEIVDALLGYTEEELEYIEEMLGM